MTHVDYLCPICDARIGTARVGAYADPLDPVTCDRCHRKFRFHDLLPKWNAGLLRSSGFQPPPPPTAPNVRVALGTNSATNTSLLTIPSFSVSQGSTLIIGAMDSNNIGDPPTTVACVWNAQSIPLRLDYFPLNPPGNLFGPRSLLFEANNLSAGTGSATITWTGDPFIGQLNAFATELKVGPTPDNSIGTNDANNSHPNGDITGDPIQPQEIFIGVLATLGTTTDLAGALADNCTIGQNITQVGSSIIELYRTDSGIQGDTHMGITNYNPPVGRLWSMIVADFKIP